MPIAALQVSECIEELRRCSASHDRPTAQRAFAVAESVHRHVSRASSGSVLLSDDETSELIDATGLLLNEVLRGEMPVVPPTHPCATVDTGRGIATLLSTCADHIEPDHIARFAERLASGVADCAKRAPADATSAEAALDAANETALLLAPGLRQIVASQPVCWLLPRHAIVAAEPVQEQLSFFVLQLAESLPPQARQLQEATAAVAALMKASDGLGVKANCLAALKHCLDSPAPLHAPPVDVIAAVCPLLLVDDEDLSGAAAALLFDILSAMHHTTDEGARRDAPQLAAMAGNYVAEGLLRPTLPDLALGCRLLAEIVVEHRQSRVALRTDLMQLLLGLAASAPPLFVECGLGILCAVLSDTAVREITASVDVGAVSECFLQSAPFMPLESILVIAEGLLRACQTVELCAGLDEAIGLRLPLQWTVAVDPPLALALLRLVVCAPHPMRRLCSSLLEEFVRGPSCGDAAGVPQIIAAVEAAEALVVSIGAVLSHTDAADFLNRGLLGRLLSFVHGCCAVSGHSGSLAQLTARLIHGKLLGLSDGDGSEQLICNATQRFLLLRHVDADGTAAFVSELLSPLDRGAPASTPTFAKLSRVAVAWITSRCDATADEFLANSILSALSQAREPMRVAPPTVLELLFLSRFASDMCGRGNGSLPWSNLGMESATVACTLPAHPWLIDAVASIDLLADANPQLIPAVAVALTTGAPPRGGGIADLAAVAPPSLFVPLAEVCLGHPCRYSHAPGQLAAGGEKSAIIKGNREVATAVLRIAASALRGDDCARWKGVRAVLQFLERLSVISLAADSPHEEAAVASSCAAHDRRPLALRTMTVLLRRRWAGSVIGSLPLAYFASLPRLTLHRDVRVAAAALGTLCAAAAAGGASLSIESETWSAIVISALKRCGRAPATSAAVSEALSALRVLVETQRVRLSRLGVCAVVDECLSSARSAADVASLRTLLAELRRAALADGDDGFPHFRVEVALEATTVINPA